MEYSIRAHVDELFRSAPDTRRAYEMKVELTENLIEKYHGYIAEGKNEEDAYNLTILSIGDVSELFASLGEDEPRPISDTAQAQKVTTTFTAIGVMMYVLSLVPLVVFGNTLGLVLMLIVAALATGIVVYAQMNKPRTYQGNDVVSDFRNWSDKNSNNKQLRNSISSTLWMVVLVLYFIISFSTGKWAVTWIIFLIGAAAEGVVFTLFNIDKGKK